MPQPIDRAGTFRGEIVSFGLSQKEGSQSVAVYLKASIHEHYNKLDEVWEDWRGYECEAEGWLYIIGRDGKILEAQAQSLVKYAGWDGQLTTITDGNWEPDRVSMTVKENTYNGNTSYRIEWINDYDRTPKSSGGNVDSKTAAELQSRFGGQFRALAGGNRSQQGGQKSTPQRPRNTPAPSASEGNPF